MDKLTRRDSFKRHHAHLSTQALRVELSDRRVGMRKHARASGPFWARDASLVGMIRAELARRASANF